MPNVLTALQRQNGMEVNDLLSLILSRERRMRLLLAGSQALARQVILGLFVDDLMPGPNAAKIGVSYM